MKMARKMLGMILVGILGLGIFGDVCAAKVVEPTSEFYVRDDAEILSEETEKFIVENSEKLAEAQGAQIVVVTVKNMGGETVEDYANELFNEWGIGDKDKDNGLLILFALEERKSRIEIGDGMAGYITDGMSGRMQDEYMIPLYKEGKYEEGLKNGYSAFYAEVAKHYGEETGVAGKKVSSEEDEDGLAAIIMIVIFILVVVLVRKKGRFISSGISTGGWSSGSSGGSSGGWSSSGSSSGSSGGGGSSSGGGSSRGF